MNVVSVMAHQDDEMRCLGTMLKCRARGDRLFFVTLTDGSKGFVHMPEIDPSEAARIRHDEMTAVATAVGAEYINLRGPDEFLYDTPAVRMGLIEAIRKARPDLLFTHWYEDYNQDHIITHDLVRHCAMQSCLPVLPTQSPPLAVHPAIFLVPPHGPFLFPATHFVDIGVYEEEKVQILLSHSSQDEAMRKAVGAARRAGVRSRGRG
jgi:LmbE family N-acetylglucosaminyl deacetylase